MAVNSGIGEVSVVSQLCDGCFHSLADMEASCNELEEGGREMRGT